MQFLEFFKDTDYEPVYQFMVPMQFKMLEDFDEPDVSLPS